MKHLVAIFVPSFLPEGWRRILILITVLVPMYFLWQALHHIELYKGELHLYNDAKTHIICAILSPFAIAALVHVANWIIQGFRNEA